MITKITNKNLLILLLIASVTALVFVYISQYFFNLEPCILCFYQRKPFLAIVAVSALTLSYFKSEKSKRIALYLCTFLLVINFIIASYHSGVEKKFFKGPTTCSSENLKNVTNLKELEQALITAKTIRCDEPNFFFLKLSMANWNALYCLALLFYIAAVRLQRRSTPL
ncbi:MAG: disulfide bond formation protein B [Rickettsiales bacterium]|nr:disulfide bond formation protein B [Rickettsiales bacterium]